MKKVMRIISEKDLQIIALIGVCYQHLFLISTIKQTKKKLISIAFINQCTEIARIKNKNINLKIKLTIYEQSLFLHFDKKILFMNFLFLTRAL